MTPTASSKNNKSPGKFIRPADLFKMRRNSTHQQQQNQQTNHIILTPNNNSGSSNPGANISFHLHSSPIGGFSQQPKLLPPVPSSPNFKRISAAHHVEPPSPLKCLSNLADPSPTKNLPTILKNPFDKPVKRRLNMSPKKAIKRSKMQIALDEDANLEPPKTKPSYSPVKGKNCFINDWTLKTKLKIRFDSFCKNWNETASTTHRRFEDLSPHHQDSSISLEAIKNIATVYQHPYLAWLPLYPRTTGFYKKDSSSSSSVNNFTKCPDITNKILGDWCDCLDDLTNLLIEGRCPYFYLCAENYNVLFKHTPSSESVQAFVSPFSFGMATELTKLQIGYRYPAAELTSRPRDGSQIISSVLSRSTHLRLDNSSSQDRMAPSIDSGHCSELSDDEDGINDDGDASQILETFGISESDLGTSLIFKPKGFVVEAESNTQSSSQVPLAIIEGADDLKKFIKFLKTNRLYTITNLGKFAHIPPTLLSPHQFRYGTPQVPEVLLSQNVMERNKSPSKSQFRLKSKLHPPTGSSNSNSTIGPAFIEISGTVLPTLYKELNNLLVLSENKDHTCQSMTLESSAPFSTIKF